jgi:hypothetical protein
MTESKKEGERPSVGPEASTRYCRPLEVVILPELSGVGDAAGVAALTVGTGDATGCGGWSLGRGTASLRGAVWQLAAKRRTAGERRREIEVMMEGGVG